MISDPFFTPIVAGVLGSAFAWFAIEAGVVWLRKASRASAPDESGE